jgi:hypothetical protein
MFSEIDYGSSGFLGIPLNPDILTELETGNN